MYRISTPPGCKTSQPANSYTVCLASLLLSVSEVYIHSLLVYCIFIAVSHLHSYQQTLDLFLPNPL